MTIYTIIFPIHKIRTVSVKYLKKVPLPPITVHTESTKRHGNMIKWYIFSFVI